ncbi:MAG: hypothetical protein EOP49_13155 [Sphingobacteriales bacterium]|nr:MAG: hypothetical protein EOP49_13155 [Sphingobacteriales bacterium]
MRFLFILIGLMAAGSAHAQDSLKSSQTFRPFTEVALGAGISFSREIIANTENIPAAIFSLEYSRHFRKLIFGGGYTAQPFVYKSTVDGVPSVTYKLAAPAHTLYAFGRIAARKSWGYIYLGALAGFATGKAKDRDEWSLYESCSGLVAGLSTGINYQIAGPVGLSFDLAPKAYLLNFSYTKNGEDKSKKHTVLTAPVMLGLRVRF